MSELLPSLADAPFCQGVKIGVGVIRKSPLSGGVGLEAVDSARAPVPQRQRRAAAAAAAAAAVRRNIAERVVFVVVVEVE